MSKHVSASPARRVVKRSTAAAMLGLCVRTLERRERSDPRFPPRVGLGIAGGAPWGYLIDDLDAYVAGLPRVRAPVADRQGAAARGVADASGADTPERTPAARPPRAAT